MTFKILNRSEKIFYVFEISTIQFSVFDSKLDAPIYSGNWLMTSQVIKAIKKLGKDVTICYYTVNPRDGTLKYEPFWSQRKQKKYY